MKRLFYIILIFTLSCTEERVPENSFLLQEINRITLTSTTTDFIIQDNLIQPEIDISYFNSQGETIGLGSLKPNFIVNGEKETSLRIPLNIAEVYEVSVMVGDLESNQIDFNVISLADAATSVELLGEPQSFFINDRAINLEEHYSAKVTDRFGTVHDLSLSDNRLTVLSDQNTVQNINDADIQPGVRELSVSIGEKTSNIIEIFVNDPLSAVGKIELTLDTLSNVPYGIANQSIFGFEYKIFDHDDNEIDLDNIVLFQNDEAQATFNNIALNNIGENDFYAEAYGVRSNIVKIDSREDLPIDVKIIPVIFHVYHNGEAIGEGNNISAQTIKNEIDRVNLAYSNQFRQTELKDNNAVNTYLQFSLASVDESGNTLTELGINRIQTSTPVFSTNSNETTDMVFENMWNPKMYLNVNVLKLDDVFSFAFYPTLKNDLPGVGVNSSDNPQLTYAYGVFLNNVHFNSSNQVLAHEFGHALSLPHTFAVVECNEDDFSNDTPNYINIPENLNARYRSACDGTVFYSTNYMDYNDGNFNSFTYDQRERMQFVWENAHFFPGSLGTPAEGGRFETTQHWKGELDHSIQPIKCVAHSQLSKINLFEGKNH